MEIHMLGEGSKNSFEGFLQKLQVSRELMDYLEKNGINASKSRLRSYSDFYEKHLENKLSEDDVRENLLYVTREMDEWSWIYKGLKIHEPEGVFKLLEAAVGGSLYAKDEGENTRARNIQLELRVGSYFIQAGYEVNFSGREDLVVKIGKYSVFIECKRIGSMKQVQKRAKESIDQLRSRYETVRGPSYGLVVLDVSRLLDPAQGTAIGINEIAARDGTRAHLVKFDQENDTSAIFSKDKHLIAVWQQAIVPTLHIAEGCLATRFSSIYSIYAKPGQRKWEIFQKMRRAFEVA